MKLSSLEKDLIFRDNLIWLLSAQAICIFPLLIKLPFWIWIIWVFALVWRIRTHLGYWRFPATPAKLVLGVGCAGGIYLSYSGVSGVEPMVGFLVCSFILKIVEMRTKKDALIVLFIGFVAVAAQFLFAQDVIAGLYGIFSLFILLTAWQAAFYSRRIAARQYFRIGGTLILQAAPFMVILFIVMPRLGPLWAVPLPQGQGRTGFSDTLEMGDLGSLVQSSEVAFRVSFAGSVPPPQQMYWRGLILDEFDGQRWQANAQPARAIGDAVSDALAGAETIGYSVIMEPHHYRWLFVLDPVLAARSAQLRLEYDERGLLSSRRPVVNKVQYSAVSSKSPLPSAQSLSKWEEKRLTHLPADGNPRATQMVEEWIAAGLSPQQLIDRALNIFHDQFVYTMRPPRLGADAVDDFLFETQRGFCEHFASAFVYLMRRGGVPARIVVGYQGGEFNPIDAYFVIRQSDAHAWVEVWLEGEGWRRIDPTAAVAPSRIEQGVEEALAFDERDLVGRVRWSSAALHSLYQYWDSVGYSWNRWVLNYDKDSQRNLLSDLLGGSGYWRVAAAFAGASAAIFFVYALFFALQRQRRYLREEDRLIHRILKRVDRRGYARKPQETLEQFAARVFAVNPPLGHELNQLARLYSASVYAEDATAAQQLQIAARQFLRKSERP